jgi:hypothetical protein
VESPEVLEEIARIQHEFGACRIQFPAELASWWYDVTRVEFDAEAQAIRLVSDQ